MLQPATNTTLLAARDPRRRAGAATYTRHIDDLLTDLSDGGTI